MRDRRLLESALARPKRHFAYAESADPIGLAAVHTGGIVQNHPFVDGSKRTGVVIGILFLELDGYRFTASQEDAANAVLALASGEVQEIGYASFLRANTQASGSEGD